jgi:DNA-binding CsgD family transcriptional regulator
LSVSSTVQARRREAPPVPAERAPLGVGLRLAIALPRDGDALEGLGVLAELLSRELATPAATWCLDRLGPSLDLVAAEGLSDAQHRQLIRFARSCDLDGDPDGSPRLLVDLFQRITRSTKVTAIDVGCGLLALGGWHPDLEDCRAELADLLSGDHLLDLTPIEQLEPIDLSEVERGRYERLQLEQLTPREREVLALLARGVGTQELAGRLGISTKTVKTHVQNILGKLDVGSRLEAVALATRHGPTSRRAS